MYGYHGLIISLWYARSVIVHTGIRRKRMAHKKGSGKDRYERPEWRLAVLERDNYTCQICRDTIPRKIIAHHIVPVNLGGQDIIGNGLSLCITCHLKIHITLSTLPVEIIIHSRITRHTCKKFKKPKSIGIRRVTPKLLNFRRRSYNV